MTISEVSEKYGISCDTLRWYEKIGLLKNVGRKSSGLRDYNETNCKTVEFIKCMRDAGVAVETLIEYMNLFEEGDSTLEKRKNLLVMQREIILKKRADLDKSIQRMNYKIENYESLIDIQKKMIGGNQK